MVDDADSDGPLLGMQQAAWHLGGGRNDEGVAARGRSLDGPERRVVQLHQLAELAEVVADDREVVFVVQVPDPHDPVLGVGVAEHGAERETRVGGVGDQPPVAQDVHDLPDAAGLGILRMDVEVAGHHPTVLAGRSFA